MGRPLSAVQQRVGSGRHAFGSRKWCVFKFRSFRCEVLTVHSIRKAHGTQLVIFLWLQLSGMAVTLGCEGLLLLAGERELNAQPSAHVSGGGCPPIYGNVEAQGTLLPKVKGLYKVMKPCRECLENGISLESHPVISQKRNSFQCFHCADLGNRPMSNPGSASTLLLAFVFPSVKGDDTHLHKVVA